MFTFEQSQKAIDFQIVGQLQLQNELIMDYMKIRNKWIFTTTKASNIPNIALKWANINWKILSNLYLKIRGVLKGKTNFDSFNTSFFENKHGYEYG